MPAMSLWAIPVDLIAWVQPKLAANVAAGTTAGRAAPLQINAGVLWYWLSGLHSRADLG